MANRKPEYSVWNEPTSSCSASTRSNGGRLSSAVAARQKITNGRNQVVQRFQPNMLCDETMQLVVSVPDTSTTASTASPSAASYDTIWALARTEPSSGYFEPDDQPASMTP